MPYAAAAPRRTRPVDAGATLKRKDQVISNASTRDVRLELDLLEQEEDAATATTQRWSLRFTSEAMETRFQLYHEEMSLPTSRRACFATILALLVMHSGAIYQSLTSAVPVDGSNGRWPAALVFTLSLNGAAAVVWGFILLSARHVTIMNGSFQWLLLATAVCVILIVLGQPAVFQPRQNSDAATQQLTQLMLFLLMLLSSIATLWNIQFLVFCGLSCFTVAALVAYLAVGGAVYVETHWHVVVLFIVTLVGLARSVFRTEKGLRAKFLRVRHLLLENIKLSQQNTFMQQQLSSHVDAIGISGSIEASGFDSSLSGSEQSGVLSSPTNGVAGLGESWMENVLKVLHHLKLQLSGQDGMTQELEYVMQTLTSDHDLFRGPQQQQQQQQQYQYQQQQLFRSSKTTTNNRRGGGGGGGNEEWLHLIDDQQRPPWRRRKSVEFSPWNQATAVTVVPPPTVMKPLRRTTSGFRQTVVKQVDSYLSISRHQRTIPMETPPTSASSLSSTSSLSSRHKWSAKKLLTRAMASAGTVESEVDLLNFATVCAYPLTSVLLTTLEAHDLFVALPIRLEAAAEFAMEIEARYQAKNPYHNAIHGAFVVWDINFFLHRLHVAVSPLEILSALVAGAVHDVNHPGLSNAYLTNTNSPLAIKYSDDSVLERMHLAEAFQACTKDNCDIFEGLSKDQKRQSRKLIITMVLATDLSGHLKHVNKLKSKRYVAKQSPSASDLMSDAKGSGAGSGVGSGAPGGAQSGADDLVFQTIIMMADLGHATKSFGYHFAWSKLVTEEFFRQGDVEKQFQLPISPLCDRENNVKFDKSQVGFLEFVVLPLYSAAKDVLPMAFDGILEKIHANNDMWKKRADCVEKGLTPPLPPPTEVGTTGKAKIKKMTAARQRRTSRQISGMMQVAEEEDEEEEDEEDTEERTSSSSREGGEGVA